MNKKPFYLAGVIFFCFFISFSAYASEPPPSGLSVTVVPNFDIYGNAQKKIQISWDPYISRKNCCDNDIDRLLGYTLIISLKSTCYAAGNHILSLPNNQTSYTSYERGDINIVQVSVSAIVVDPGCYKCSSSASYGTESTTQVVNMATEGCFAYLSIPTEDTDICSSKRKEIGEPISVLNGEMTLEETDFKIEGINLDLEFKRNYSSRQQLPNISSGITAPMDKSNGSILFTELMEVGRSGGSSPYLSKSYNSLTTGAPIGWGWSHNFNVHLDFLQSGNVIRLVNEKGRSLYFYRQSTESSYYLQSGKPTSNSLQDNGDMTYSLKDENGGLMLFGSKGELLSVISAEGNHIELEYDSSEKLIKLYDTLGRHYSLNYDSYDRITSIVEDSQDVTIVSYIYDSSGHLTSASYPDNSSATYEYEDSYDNINITKTTGRDGIIHSYIYDITDRVTSFSDDNEKHFSSLEYHPNEWYTRLTNTKGVSIFFHYESINRTGIFKSTTGYSCSTCASPFFSYTSDEIGRIYETKDSYGNITFSENFDNSGRPQLIRYGKGSDDEKIVYYLYHPDIDVTLSIKTQSVFGSGFRETIADYDDDGNDVSNENPGALVSRLILKGFTRDEQKNLTPFQYITTLSYDTYSRIVSIDGPRTDISDVSSFEYYPLDSQYGLNRGRLKSITGPSGNKHTYEDYDIYGNAGKIIFPDSTFTILSYDSIGNLTEASKDSAIWQYIYYTGGVLHYEKMPEGNIIEYSYNEFGDLSMVKLRKGPELNSNVLETSIFTYDTERNPTSLEIKEGDENGTTVLNEEYFFGYLNELKYIYPDASDKNIKFEMANSLLLNKFRQASLPEGEFSMEYSYDSLLRLVKATEFPGNLDFATNYLYDNLGNIKTISDSSGNATAFEYDDLGRTLNINSPQRGEEIFSYDALSSSPSMIKDALGRTRYFSYDVLGRIITVNYVNENETLNLKYDEAQSTYGKGRLTSMSDGNTELRYHYDVYGNISEEDKTMDGKSYSIRYTYNKNGRVNKISYPSGTDVLYNYTESWSLPSEIKIKKTNGNILNMSITQGAEGKIKEIHFPSGITETLGYDRQYRINSLTIEKQNSDKLFDSVYERDLDGNVTFITDTLDADQSLTFSYDLFGRITNSSGPYGNLGFSYDGVGNRIHSILNGIERNYSYSENTLNSISGDMTKNYSYNSEGKLISDGNVSLSYDKNNRIQSVNINGDNKTSYSYDFDGQRDRKTKEGNWQNYFYDLDGRLISVMDRNGNCLADFIYAGDERVAVVMPQSETPVGSYRSAKGKVKPHRRHLLGTYKIKFKMAGSHLKIKIKKKNKKKKHRGKSFKALVEPKVTVYGLANWDSIRKILSADVKIKNKTSTINVYDVDARITGISDSSVTPFNPDGITSGKSFWYYGNISKGSENIVHWEFHDPNTHSFNFTAKIMGSYSATGQTVYFYHNDHLGRPVMMTDESGNVSWRGTYYPFGKLYEQTNSIENNFRFPGQWKDDETGFFYNGARYYDPDTGRYLSPDPVIATPYLPQTLNPYVYVTNNPLRYVDPEGLYGKDVHYDLTYSLALQTGFTKEEAMQIAKADQGMDDSIFTSPFNPLGGTQMHFMPRKYALKGLEQAFNKKDINYFGQFLHIFQDTFSHKGFKWYTGGHIYAGTRPDQYCPNSKRDKAMREETLKYLLFFKDVYHLRCAHCNEN